MDDKHTIDAAALRELILGKGELALLDVRGEGAYSEGHILQAVSMPLGYLEREAPLRVPRRATPVVVCDAGEGLAGVAAERLRAHGYSDVRVLDGAVAGWGEAGFEVFSGVNVPSKAFGELVEHECQTPSLSADEVKAMIDAGEDMVVLDSRPMPEYHARSIPTGICVPGAELAYRVHDLVPSPDTTVVVNCAGRTRSIIGAQSLINAGIANRVVALRNGTMGWHLAGHTCDTGQARTYSEPTEQGLSKARAAAAQVCERFGVRRIDRTTLGQWQAEADERTVYVFDVRSPEEFAAGHLPGTRSAPGGQLVQATDEYVGTLRSRIVLVDDNGVRSAMTASWLVQMGWTEVAILEGVLAGSTLYGGQPAVTVLGAQEAAVETIDVESLAAALEDGGATVVDLSNSVHYKAGHVPGAGWATRVRLSEVLAGQTVAGTLVLTCEDGQLSRLAAAEVTTSAPVRVLEGGFAAWAAADQPVASGAERMLDVVDDSWRKPTEPGRRPEDSMQDYLTWEIALVAQLERDGTTDFSVAGAQR